MRSDIVDMYKNNNLSIIFINMVKIYKSIRGSERLMTYNFHRDKFLQELSNDLNRNKHLFDN